MPRAKFILILLSILSISAPAFAWEFEVFETRGSAYERGVQHGQHFKDEIQNDFKNKDGWGWSVGLVNRTPPMLAHFLVKVRELPKGQELIDEMQGIADGSGIPFTDILGLNLTFDLGERTACSMAILPNGPDGPILVNTLDDFIGGKAKRNYPCFIQVAYPTDGHAMISLCNFGTVWAHQGLNDAGLAVGSTSGGLGFPRGGANYDGVYYALLHRYALQFFEHADDAIKLFTDHRQISKGINLSVLDRDGKGAILEFAAMAVGVRPVSEAKPVYCTNFFQTDVFPKYDESIYTYDYMKNAKARYVRFDELIGPKSPPSLKTDLAFAEALVHDENGGKQGQIRQDNSVMITAVANVWSCKSATGYCYTRVLAAGEPKVIKLDASKKPTSGKPAPATEAVSTVLGATPPKKIAITYVQLKKDSVTEVDDDGMAFGFTHADKPMRAELSAAQVLLYTPGTLKDIVPDTLTVCTGKPSADGSSLEAAEIVTHQPKRAVGGRWLNGELSGSFKQNGSDLSVVYDPAKPPVKVILAKDCHIILAKKVQPAAALKSGQMIDVFGHVLFEGDAVHVSYLLIRDDLRSHND